MFNGTLDKWIFAYALLTAGLSQMVVIILFPKTPANITHRRIGTICSFVFGFIIAGIHGCVLQYPLVRILWRGLWAVAGSNFVYDHTKTLLGEIFKMKTPS